MLELCLVLGLGLHLAVGEGEGEGLGLVARTGVRISVWLEGMCKVMV